MAERFDAAFRKMRSTSLSHDLKMDLGLFSRCADQIFRGVGDAQNKHQLSNPSRGLTKRRKNNEKSKGTISVGSPGLDSQLGSSTLKRTINFLASSAKTASIMIFRRTTSRSVSSASA